MREGQWVLGPGRRIHQFRSLASITGTTEKALFGVFQRLRRLAVAWPTPIRKEISTVPYLDRSHCVHS
jgi:hypothetical protein